ncbi:hypothetical protein CAP36_06815 [Chitinophagaceae bacterium IBVUCB2]|nr:hypothetical protein CAP36_06815 [Chitinophagaceae bacterium IBVUCB2]
MLNKLLILILVFLAFALVCCSPTTEELYTKAYKLEEEKKYKEAIEVYDRIIKKTGKLQDAWFNKGWCYLQDSNYTKALHFFEIVLKMKGVNSGNSVIIEMNPDLPFASEADRHQISLNEVYYQMAIAKYNLDSLAASYRLFKHCSKQNYNTGNCYVWQGLIWTRYDSMDRACGFFQQAKMIGEGEADRFIDEFCKETK